MDLPLHLLIDLFLGGLRDIGRRPASQNASSIGSFKLGDPTSVPPFTVGPNGEIITNTPSAPKPAGPQSGLPLQLAEGPKGIPSPYWQNTIPMERPFQSPIKPPIHDHIQVPFKIPYRNITPRGRSFPMPEINTHPGYRDLLKQELGGYDA